jgi:hypothetical protein
MLYIGAVQNSGVYLAPKHVYRMTGRQAAKSQPAARTAYSRNALAPGFTAPGSRWYADNTREPIRDETLREGLLAVGAAIARDDLPTTSGKPRYALAESFAALFDPLLVDDLLDQAITAWQEKNLTKGALARITLLRHGMAQGDAGVLTVFPNGETRRLSPGLSSVITRAVVEVFAPRFLEVPAILWLSESGNKVVARDDFLAAKIGIRIASDRNLPDLILIDLGTAEPLIVFVEVVATDGAITSRRQEALSSLTSDAGFRPSNVAFLTAYQDREAVGFKKTVSGLAWGSFAWFMSEPEQIVQLHDGSSLPGRLKDLLDLGARR